ncbi:MAG: hypothetical protein IKC74_02910 [Clostridia bacterium]|nr:hypothetical protein [Clostridia bacterium]
MKKIIAILMVAVFVLSLASCGTDPYEDLIGQLEEMNRAGYFYTDAQIEAMKNETGIKENITAYANFSTIDENENETYLYIAQFENSEAAQSFWRTHTLEFKYAFFVENVVIYGSDSTINDLEF